MATRKQKIKVGAFLVICFGLLAIGIAMVAGLIEDQGVPYWSEYDESIMGLSNGSQVFYLGVPVGKVTDIFVTPLKKAHVEFVIDPEKVELQAGVEGRLRIYSIAAGTMAISLAGGDPMAQPLPANSQIPAKQSIFALSGEIEGMMGNLASIAESIDTGLAGMEPGELANLVADGRAFLRDTGKLVNETTDTIAALRGDAQDILGQFKDLSGDVKELTIETKGLVGAATAKIDDLQLAETGERLNRVLENIGDLSEKMNGLVANVGSLSDEVAHNVDDVEYTVRSSLKELTEAFGSLGTFVDELRADPASVIRGRGRVKDAE